MNQFTSEDKKHINHRHIFSEAPGSSHFVLQLTKTSEDYFYWKNKLKEVNKKIVDLKKTKTQAYLSSSTTFIQTLNEKLFWWRNYYADALMCYYDAKHMYNCAQKAYSDFIVKQRIHRKNAEQFKGKYCYKITIKPNAKQGLDANGWSETYFIRSESDYLDENNFKDEFDYDLHLALERFPDKLKKYNWGAWVVLSNIYHLYHDLDAHTDIERADKNWKDVLIDFAQFHAWRSGTIADESRITFEEFKQYKIKELGDNAFDAEPGELPFCIWFTKVNKNAKEVWNNTSDTLVFNLRKTLHYWQKYYDNWIASDKHIGKSNEK